MASYWRVSILVGSGLLGLVLPDLAATLSGRVVDLNGQAVADAHGNHRDPAPGPALTVFSDVGWTSSGSRQGSLRRCASDLKVTLRALGHELLDSHVTDAAR